MKFKKNISDALFVQQSRIKTGNAEDSTSEELATLSLPHVTSN